MLRNDGERLLGRGNDFVFLGRSRSFPAPANIPIRKQPCTQPHCLALGSRSQSQSTAPTSHFPQNNTLPSHTNLFSSLPQNPCPCNDICLCHRLPPMPPPSYTGKQKASSESKDSDEPPSTSIDYFKYHPLFFLFIFLFIAFLLSD